MTARLDHPRERRRFYLAVALVALAWVTLAMVVGGAIGGPVVLRLILTISGIAAILMVAVRHPRYRRIQTGHHFYRER
jgi:MFS family permease